MSADDNVGQVEPLGAYRRKHAKYWIGVFVTSIGSVFLFVAAITSWTNFHSSADRVLAKLLLLEAVAITLAAALTTLGALTFYYRTRYLDFKQQRLVKDVYPDRSRLVGNYMKLIDEATTQFVASGISLNTLTTHPDLPDAVRRALGNHSHLTISLLYMDPLSMLVAQREKEEERSPGRIALDCVKNIETALAIRASVGSEKERLRIFALSNFAPVGFFLVSDKDLYFEPYLDKRQGRTAPTFLLRDNAANHDLWRQMFSHLGTLMERARVVTHTDDITGLRIRTTFGEASDRNRLERAIFLDRDGVLVDDRHYTHSPDDVHLLPGAAAALKLVAQRYRLIVVTNQSGIARGLVTLMQLHRVNQRVLADLEREGVALDAIYSCPHHPTVGETHYTHACECRKPRPGMILEAIRRFRLAPELCILIGDKPSDIEAGRAAGVATIGVGEATHGLTGMAHWAGNVAQAIGWVHDRDQRGGRG